MKAIETLNTVTRLADAYSREAKESLIRNNHMNEIEPDETIEQRHIDAVLVDFINFMGLRFGVDYALYSSDLRTKKVII